MNIILRAQTKPQSVASKPTLTRGVTEYRGRILHLPRTTMHANIYSLPAKCFFKTAIAQEFTILNLQFKKQIQFLRYAQPSWTWLANHMASFRLTTFTDESTPTFTNATISSLWTMAHSRSYTIIVALKQCSFR